MRFCNFFYHRVVIPMVLSVAFWGILGCSTSTRKASTPAISESDYNTLLKKYESLQNEIRDLRSTQREQANDLIEKEGGLGPELVQTVDVFAQEKNIGQRDLQSVNAGEPAPASPAVQEPEAVAVVTDLSDHDAAVLESQLFDIRKAQSVFAQGNYQEGMDILKSLQETPYPQIRVRAQFLMSEGFFSQGEYDLALQGYEDIIHRGAFSGLVIRALKRLVDCTEKLGIEDKRARYRSMLDFFKAKRS